MALVSSAILTSRIDSRNGFVMLQSADKNCQLQHWTKSEHYLDLTYVQWDNNISWLNLQNRYWQSDIWKVCKTDTQILLSQKSIKAYYRAIALASIARFLANFLRIFQFVKSLSLRHRLAGNGGTGLQIILGDFLRTDNLSLFLACVTEIYLDIFIVHQFHLVEVYWNIKWERVGLPTCGAFTVTGTSKHW